MDIDTIKVHIFWEGHKFLWDLLRRFDWNCIGQICGGDFAKFCGLLRMHELWLQLINIKIAFSDPIFFLVFFSDVAKYPKIMNEDTGEVQFNPFEKKNWDNCESYPIKNSSDNNYVVRVPLPRRSLLILYGNPRYNWEHCVLRKDISSRRIVIAYRELTPTYLPNGLEESIGQEILEKAENFFWFITFEYFGMIKLWEYKKHKYAIEICGKKGNNSRFFFNCFINNQTNHSRKKNLLIEVVPTDLRSFRTGPKKILEDRSVQDLKIAKRTSKDFFFDQGTIELYNNTLNGLSLFGGLMSPSGGFASLLFDQGLHLHR